MRVGAEEQLCFDSRRHSAVLVRPFVRALALGGVGVLLLVGGVAAAVVGALALAVSSLVALRAVWRWERTRLVVTTERLAVVRGTMRRRTAVIPLHSVDVLELDQSLPGRIFGYGTVVAGPLAIDHVSQPRELCRLLSRLAA